MVPTKITCPSRSDDIGNQNTKRYGFFANESQGSQYFESGRNRSFKGRKESGGELYKRNYYRRSNRFGAFNVSFDANNQLFRGKTSAAVYLKPEPVFDSTMFHVSDCEFFQDLAPLCSDLDKEEQVQATDFPEKTEEYPHKLDNLHTQFSPPGWDVFDANSPSSGAYIPTINDPLSPIMDGFTHIDNKFLYSTDVQNEHKLSSQDMDWDISKMQVVLGDLAPEDVVDVNRPYVAEATDYHNTDTSTNTHNKLIFDSDDFDTKFVTVMPSEVENRNIVEPERDGFGSWSHKPWAKGRRAGLSLDVNLLGALDAGNTLSTPEVLNFVEQLEKGEYPLPSTNKPHVQIPEQDIANTQHACREISPVPVEYQPITPESHLDSDNDDSRSRCSSRRKRKNSEDSDQTYMPDVEYIPRKYKRRKPNISIKDKIQALEESQETQAPRRRGRPPKRRISTISSVCSGDVDDNNSSFSTQEVKYRELRDKNNEASKRSRMNRKLKELQMEQMALELEERNKKLKVRADILEDMTKRLKDALMTAILQK